jgi:glycosyltransferase involved in cell wall biosynthesis
MISVIIPTYNRSALLKRAINSVLSQTLPVLEIIISDDGSTDDTEIMVSSYCNEKIKFLKNIHSGKPAVPRNNAIKMAKGTWIAFLDSDDEWHPQKLEKQIEICNKLDISAICSNALHMNSRGECQGDYLLHKSSGIFGFNELLNENIIVCSSVLIKKKLIDKIGGFDENDSFRAIEDYLLWLKVGSISNWFFISEALLNYSDNFEISIRSSDSRSGDEHSKIVKNELLRWLPEYDYLSRNYILTKNKNKTAFDFIARVKATMKNLINSIR